MAAPAEAPAEAPVEPVGVGVDAGASADIDVVEDICKLVKTHKESGELQQAYEAAKAGVKDQSGSARLQWEFARACYDLAGEHVAKNDKKAAEAVYFEGLSAAQECKKLDESVPQGWKWVAIILGKLGDFKSTSDKIKDTYLIKENGLKAAELDPEDCTTQHLLGVWCYNVANVGWVTRKAASAIFAEPPSSSFEEAEAFFLKAEASPFPENRAMLGDTYYAMSRYADAKVWYQKCLDMPPTNKSVEVLHSEVTTKLRRC